MREFTDGIDGIDASQAMQMIMCTQHLDMLKEVGTSSKGTATFVRECHCPPPPVATRRTQRWPVRWVCRN